MKPGSDRRWRRHGIVLRGGKSRGCFCGLPSFLAADGVDRSIEFSFPGQFPVRPHFPHVGIRVRRRSEPSKASATISARRLRRVFAFNGRLLGIVSSPPLEPSSRTSSAVSAQNSASWCTDGQFDDEYYPTIFEICCALANFDIQEGGGGVSSERKVASTADGSPMCARKGTRKSCGPWKGPDGGASVRRRRRKLRLKKTGPRSTIARRMRRMSQP
jgi:hypothetical protein